MITRNHQQEGLSRAYIQAVAARAGMSCSVPSPDYGIDLSIHEIVTVNGQRMESGHRIDIQAKSTTSALFGKTTLRYDLDSRGYAVLRDPNVGAARILVVLLLPEDTANWLTITEDALLLRHCAYWVSLRGREPARNRRSVRLTIPRVNIFNVEGLLHIMAKARTGAAL